MQCYDCNKELTESVTYKTSEGKFYKCLECDNERPFIGKKQKCEVYSRIVGYMRPVDNWNTAKRQEFDDRKTFEIN